MSSMAVCNLKVECLLDIIVRDVLLNVSEDEEIRLDTMGDSKLDMTLEGAPKTTGTGRLQVSAPLAPL
ncbi:Hypothetical predicted protein [Octopus vulgaris]|uniref:Uncharacterized protein n=1 Tax=Octopus vulgaris TaxID=6645 RepID=A0AA36BES5_OCTVU|nr:Hypothetical predicted protein [Octopus vulgaris]